LEIRNRDRDALPFTTKDGSTIREYLLFRRPETPSGVSGRERQRRSSG
jgi:hypothetical protein